MTDNEHHQMTETLADISAAALTGKGKHRYPTEKSFAFPLILSAIFILLPSIVLVIYPQQQMQINQLYRVLFGNYVSPFIVCIFAASCIHLLAKRQQLKKEKSATHVLSSQIIPAILSEVSTDASPQTLYQRIQEQLRHILPAAKTNNLLLSRCRVLLTQESHQGTNAQPSAHEDDAGLFEREYMRASFALPRFMVWTIPILGFIGTVLGISKGIASFSTAMLGVAAEDMSSALKDSLPAVTENLATAFDTTFLALVLSIPLMLLLTRVEKSEENYLIVLDQFWLYKIKPDLCQRLPQTMITQPAVSVLPTTAPQENGSVAAEINLLSAQVEALRETMQDLYETVFASNLSKHSDKEDTP